MFADWQVPSVSVADVSPSAHLLDVREPEEWAAGHAEGAQHIPMSQVSRRVEEIPSDVDLVVVCRSGGRSAQVTAWLSTQGRSARNLVGGMEAWSAAGRPVVSETAAPPVVV